jgi:hypothetical protein
MKLKDLTPEERACLEYTTAHFEEIARQNRFAENATVTHDEARCVICHPDRIRQDPFRTYLDVITPSVLVRRPRLDQDLADAINEDLAMEGEAYRVTLAALQSGEERALWAWKAWLRSALATGLGLLSVHSATSLDFDLDEAEAQGMGVAIEDKVNEILIAQKETANTPPAPHKTL